MKNKAFTLCVCIVLYVFTTLVAYNIGYATKVKESYEVQNEVARRYLISFGNPETEADQNMFEWVIYREEY